MPKNVRLRQCQVPECGAHLGSMDAVGSSLDKAQDTYRKARDQLVSGKANLVKQVSDFRQLGVAVKGEIGEE